MAFAPVSPISGAPMTGFTSPTYTFVPDIAPNLNGKQFVVTALGGTQAGVNVNTVSKPFTMTFFRPSVLRTLPQANPVTGVIKNIPVNSYKFVLRKGGIPAPSQNPSVNRITVIIDVAAGTESNDEAEVKAMLSLGGAVLYGQAAGIADTVKTGVM